MKSDSTGVIVDLVAYREAHRRAEAEESAGRLLHARLLGEAVDGLGLAGIWSEMS
jgi:hypothetical protein